MAVLIWISFEVLEYAAMVSINDLNDQGLILGASARLGGRNVENRLSIFDGLKPIGGDSFVDLGAGRGSYAAELVKRCKRMTLVDLNDKTLEDARNIFQDSSNVNFVVASADSTRLQGDEYDCAFIIEVLDHVSDPLAVLHEAYRLLKKGGRLYLSVPNRAFPLETHPLRVGNRFVMPLWGPFLPWVHWLHKRVATARVFSAKSVHEMAREAGFSSIQLDYMMPPFERYTFLQPFSDWLGKTPLRFFGVSICASMEKPL